MTRKAAKLMLVAATLVLCQPKLLEYLYYFHWLFGGRH
jgi:hypothetical protein